MSINTCTISGNLSSDPEVRQTASGMPVTSFRMAVTSRRKNGDEYEDYVNWISCVGFGNRYANLAQHMPKGTKVCVSGELRYSEWEKDGQRRNKVEVVVNDIDLCSQKPKKDAGGYDRSAYSAPSTPVVDTTDYYSDESIPF